MNQLTVAATYQISESVPKRIQNIIYIKRLIFAGYKLKLTFLIMGKMVFIASLDKFREVKSRLHKKNR